MVYRRRRWLEIVFAVVLTCLQLLQRSGGFRPTVLVVNTNRESISHASVSFVVTIKVDRYRKSLGDAQLFFSRKQKDKAEVAGRKLSLR